MLEEWQLPSAAVLTVADGDSHDLFEKHCW